VQDDNTPDISILFTELAQAFLSTQEEMQTLLLEAKCVKRNAQFQAKRLINNFTAVSDWLEKANSLAPPKELEVFTQRYVAKQIKKGADASALLEQALFKQVQTYCDCYPQIFQHTLMQLLDEAMGFFKSQGQAIKTETQVLSFNDLLTQLHRAVTAESGEALCQLLRERYPIAMIDEFQDTDPIQYGIFKQLYVGQAQQTLYMIGDPKQAIYSFRGGDIYTYLEAKQDVTQHHGTIYTLSQNWRSNPAMLTAVNTIFQHSASPFLHHDIQFQPISAPPEKTDHKILRINGKAVKPLTLYLSPDAEQKTKSAKPALSKDSAREQIDSAVSQYIATLLTASKNHQVLLGDQALKPSDIAILVPKHSDAERLRVKLSALGVASTTMGKKTVFESPEAAALQQLLSAIRHPNDRSLLRQALASPLLAYAYDEIYQHCHHEAAWFTWMDTFHNLYLQWQTEGFMSMFFSLLAQLDCTKALAQQAETDRMMTNLLQLGELLQQASKQYSSIDALLTWFADKCLNPSGEKAELRLESDEDTVKLVTLYASKGLEYGVVFLPYLWDLRNTDKKTPIFYHNEAQQLRADMGSQQLDQHIRLADYERVAEQCRLIYVALTRSIACCHMVWGNIAKPPYGCSDNSALGYLLHGQQNAADLKNTELSSLGKSTWTKEQIETDLDALLQTSENTVEIAALDQLTTAITPSQQLSNQHIDPSTLASASSSTVSSASTKLSSKTFTRSLANNWRIASFSSLSKNIYHNRMYIERINQDVILNFPAGKRTGLYLHRLFECLDFQADISLQVEQLNQRLLPRYGLNLEEHDLNTQQWVEQIVHTPLNKEGLKLIDIAAHKRLNEMEFHFSTSNSLVNIQQLNQLFKQYAQQHTSQSAQSVLQELTQSNFQGLINGVIDLIFEHEGRYYLVDYKSNYLGNSLEAYQYETMQDEINTRRYDLQYMLYSLALHRFLKTRLTDYNYQSHFGGVYYLYLRGMRVDNDTGIFFTLPDENFLEQLNALF
jgi:exodeoxyribonuclease V beta subunit